MKIGNQSVEGATFGTGLRFPKAIRDKSPPVHDLQSSRLTLRKGNGVSVKNMNCNVSKGSVRSSMARKIALAGDTKIQIEKDRIMLY